MKSQIIFLGTYPPRECGIATFTQDLTVAMNTRFNPEIQARVCAMNNGVTFDYGEEVIFKIDEYDLENYIKIAKKINKDKTIKVVSIQHEFGIFGGKYLNYLSAFMETVQKPVIITLHSVVPNPPENIKSIMQYLVLKATKLVVMANLAVDILERDYGIDRSKVVVIPHGIHEVANTSGQETKVKLKCEGRLVLSSFGLISGGKDYETIIKSLPAVVDKFPNVLYLIVGATHPGIVRQEGEKYRNYLIGLIEGLGLEKNVQFVNKYLELPKLMDYLLATDIFLQSGKGVSQITSGTLCYAMGCGCPVICHPFIHAQEAVNSERGILVELGNSTSYSEAIIKLLSDPVLRQELSNNAYNYTRKMIWPRVAESYLDVFQEYLKEGVIAEKTSIGSSFLE